jgi:uncharacterized protein (UPF0332 family)
MSIMSPKDLILKTNRAIESAQLLLDAGDIDGACNRAYYAMLDAAKAALLKTVPDGDPTVGKTHSGVISAFGLHLVKTGLVPVEFGRAFNRAHDIRQVADYTGDLIEVEQVDSLITQASEFVEWINCQVISIPN